MCKIALHFGAVLGQIEMPVSIRRNGGVNVSYSGAASEELVALARSMTLRFPIETKDDFVAQMVQGSDTVTFRGTEYDTEFGAKLVPAFFFPVSDLDDLVKKTLELLVSRGLAPEQSIAFTTDAT